MDVPDEGVLDVDILADDGSEDEGEAPPSSGPASTPTSCASSPRGEEPASPHGALAQISFFHHQPYSRPFFTSTRRGPGRPRKEGVKLAREGKIVRRYRATPGSVRGAKRHRSSRDDVLDDLLDVEDFVMPVSEEPPYFPEKWPGKVCALCNLGERSQLGQGEMRQINCNIPEGESTVSAVPRSGGTTPTSVLTPTSTPSTPMLPGLSSPPPELIDPQLHPLAMPVSRRQKGINKCKTPYYNLEHTDELSIIGHVEALEITAVVSNGTFYVHRCCLEFSPPFHDQVTSGSSGDDKETLEESRIKGIVIAALFRKCAFCTKHGASIPCSADIDCRTCHVVGDIANLMTCVTCGAHYHGTCVGLAQLPGVRAGWACRSCRVCQVCRLDVAPGMSPAESRAVTCEHCDKQYHATCLRPMMATVPKYGWKCKCCRVCSDCGARSPGAGPSSRWHAHYTVCDSCYQQRNKGSCCPLCRRAYRAAAQRDMIRCTLCKRYVHGMCDPDAEPQQYKMKKEQNPSYEYVCPICKPNLQLAAIKNTSFEDEGTQTPSRDSSFSEDLLQEQDPLALETKIDIGLGKGKPYTVSSKVAKKKISGYKMKGGFVAAGKLGFQKRQRSIFLDFGRKRGAKPKMRGVFGVPGLGLQRPQAPDNKTSEDDPDLKTLYSGSVRAGGSSWPLSLLQLQSLGPMTNVLVNPELIIRCVENKLVLCSSKDKFVLTQDLCVMCGAIGTDSEGCLIACSQCGQTYHPYCVSIKVSKVIVTLGWRCLDCTVCEGCGQRGDDALLVLCDDCDTAWHTYCARPQLTEVPRGSWRCERCRRCQTCGTVDTHVWNESYTECGPCASLVMCCVCSKPYSDGELIIQCEPCHRWLHATCDNIRTENDAEICCQAGYQCLLCRGRDIPPPHLAKAIESIPTPTIRVPPPAPQSFCLGREYYVDDVCLSQYGASFMKDLETKLGITHTRRKRRFKNEHPDKDAEIMASIETVVQNADTDLGNDDSKPDSTAEVKDETGIPPNPNYKEGTVWNVATDGPPPEGFTLYTTESGRTVLRRKRQRNLNKLGIGGFVVRQRQATLRAQADDEKDGDGAQPSGESPSNKRKPRRKPRSKLMEQFPSYMQEAFFGKDLLEPTKSVVTSTANPLESPGGCSSLRPLTPEGLRELRDFKVDFDNSDSDGEDVMAALTPFDDNDTSVVISLKEDEIDLLNSLKPKDDREDQGNGSTHMDGTMRIKTETGQEEVQLKHTEDSTALKNAILGPAQGESSFENTSQSESIPTVHSTKTEPIGSETGGSSAASTISPKDELSLLGVSLDAMVRDSLPDMDGADVDEIFKGVLTDDSQESQESSVSYVNSMGGTPYSQQRHQLASPMDYASPYHTEYGSGSNSQLSPAFSESGGGNSGGGGSSGGPWSSAETSTAAPPPTYNQRSTDKMRTDESTKATISAVLYANTNHPEWKTEFPVWVDRCKQILKKWRALPGDQKAPYLQRARDNRSEIRMKKAQQNSGASTTAGAVAVTSASTTGGVSEEGDGAAASSANPTATMNTSERASGSVVGSTITAVAGASANVTSGGANVPVRAPNVTVTAGGLLEADAHIRVLTPSEIMRTLPPLHHTRDSAPVRAGRRAVPSPTAHRYSCGSRAHLLLYT
ncbi:hypothetical protein EVAR_32641_1 [Eumeta japonica]|uniref:PHD-type domain-containing protein n=1 Tax=Eumeta variegata TaxID=151549 RepID=A0A4C1WW52_EUMVA|nr:hypothetical protein EVAR_32641_1 [Eumeta japonica]